MTLQAIGSYRIQEQVGGSGPTAVFRAVDPEDGQPVAIKLIGRPFIADDELDRLQQTVTAIQRLEHPAIVPVRRLAKVGGHPFLVTDWLSGGSLADRLAGGPLPGAEARAILDRIAGALDSLHQEQIYHDDLTAANVLFDDDGRAYLAGLGSRQWGDPNTRSPEQVLGLPPDAASNVYSLGALLAHALTGLPPDPDAPPQVTDLRPDLPEAVDGVIQRALDDEPAARWLTAGALAEAFGAALDGESPSEAAEATDDVLASPFADLLPPGTAWLEPEEPSAEADIGPEALVPPVPPPGELPPATPPRRRSRLWLWLLFVMLLLLLLVVGVLLVPSLIPPPATPILPTVIPTAVPPQARLPDAAESAMAAPATAVPSPTLAPGITILAPADGDSVDKGSAIQIQVLVNDPQGVHTVSLTANGQAIGLRRTGGDATVTIEQSWIPAIPGRQTLRVSATNRLGQALMAEPVTLQVIDREMLARTAPIWAAIEENVRQLRGLAPLTPVEPTVLSRGDLRRRFRDAFDYSPEQARRDALVLQAFDFVPEAFDLYAEARRYLGDNIAGFYDPATGEFVVVSDSQVPDTFARWVYVHELMHILQDQHYGLGLATEASLSFEGDLARRALAEGEAELVQTRYVEAGYFDESGLIALFNESSLQASLLARTPSSRLPSALGEAFLFPYREGSAFARYLYELDGWAALDAAWANPPQSTEQILHPDRYLAGDAPQLVTINPSDAILGAGWELLADGVLGEFYLRQYLAQVVAPELVEAAASGWGGDRYAVYGRSTDDLTVLIYRATWDSLADAGQFTAAYREYGNGRFGGAVEYVANGGECWLAATVTCLYQPDASSLIVRAPDLATAIAVAMTQ